MRQPPENSFSAPILRRFVETEAGEDFGRARRGGMGVDIGQPRVDIGDAVRVVRGFRLVQQAARSVSAASTKSISLPSPPGASCSTRPSRAPRGMINGPAFGGNLAGDEAEQRGLARAIAADEADARPFGQQDAGRIEQEARPEPVGEIGDLKHGAFLPVAAWKASDLAEGKRFGFAGRPMLRDAPWALLSMRL